MWSQLPSLLNSVKLWMNILQNWSTISNLPLLRWTFAALKYQMFAFFRRDEALRKTAEIWLRENTCLPQVLIDRTENSVQSAIVFYFYSRHRHANSPCTLRLYALSSIMLSGFTIFPGIVWRSLSDNAICETAEILTDFISQIHENRGN